MNLPQLRPWKTASPIHSILLTVLAIAVWKYNVGCGLPVWIIVAGMGSLAWSMRDLEEKPTNRHDLHLSKRAVSSLAASYRVPMGFLVAEVVFVLWMLVDYAMFEKLHRVKQIGCSLLMTVDMTTMP
jgi:hypothetical protein